MTRLSAALASVFIVSVLGLLAWWSNSIRPEPSASSTPLPTLRLATIVAPTRAASRPTITPTASSIPPSPIPTPVETSPLPASLRDTGIDGGFPLDSQGHLIASPDVRRLFDYFLSAAGEEPLEQTRQRIVDTIHSHLSGVAVDEALQLLDRYLTYRRRVRDLFLSNEGADDLVDRLAQLRHLRDEVLGERDAFTLFRDEDAHADVTIEQQRIALDPNLSDEDRERQMRLLDEQLPEDQRRARESSLAPLRLREAEDELRAAGASNDDIHSLRAQYFGADGAERLDALDRERAEWQSRYDTYKAMRSAIEGDESRSEEDRAIAIGRLLNDHFSPQEQIRVHALDSIEHEDGSLPPDP